MFNKIKNLNVKSKARGGSSSCLNFLACAFTVLFLLLPSYAQAQSNDFSSRLNRLENELETLNRAVYNGEEPQPLPTRINNRVVSNDATARMEIRLQEIEDRMRTLTGRIEEQVYTINQLKQDVINLKTANTEIPSQRQNISRNTGDDNKAQGVKAQDVAANRDEEITRDSRDKDTSGRTTTSSLITGNPTALYESAYTSLKDRDYKVSREKFETFTREYPNHVLAANSKYWLGETYYVEGEYQLAAKTFAQGFQKFPDSAKSPDMLLKLGLSLSNSGRTEEACIALSQLPIRFKAASTDILDRGVDEMDRLSCSDT